METKIVRKVSKIVKKPSIVKGKNLAKQLERFRRFGLYILILDYLFIFYIMLRVESISYIFHYELKGFTIKSRKFLYSNYGIPTLNVPGMFVLYYFMRSSSDFFKEKAMVWKNVRMLTLRSVLWALFIFILSFLFIGIVSKYISYLPADIQDKAIPAYYLSYVMIILYFTVRAFFRFDYYLALYTKEKEDYRAIFGMGLVIFFAFIMHKLPYMIFM